MNNESYAAETRIRHIASTVVSRLERQEWLDRPSYRFEHVLTIVFASFGHARERVSNFLHGTWLGHPLHPVLTDVTIGAWSMGSVMDLIGEVTDSDYSRKAADQLMTINSSLH